MKKQQVQLTKIHFNCIKHIEGCQTLKMSFFFSRNLKYQSNDVQFEILEI